MTKVTDCKKCGLKRAHAKLLESRVLKREFLRYDAVLTGTLWRDSDADRFYEALECAEAARTAWMEAEQAAVRELNMVVFGQPKAPVLSPVRVVTPPPVSPQRTYSDDEWPPVSPNASAATRPLWPPCDSPDSPHSVPPEDVPELVI